jgi:hypothetical protein
MVSFLGFGLLHAGHQLLCIAEIGKHDAVAQHSKHQRQGQLGCCAVSLQHDTLLRVFKLLKVDCVKGFLHVSEEE